MVRRIRSFLAALLTLAIVLCIFTVTALSANKNSTKKIAYAKSGNLWLMNTNGTQKQQLTNLTDSTALLSSISWSPSGKKIAFVYTPKANQYEGSNQLLIYDIDTGQTSGNLAGTIQRADNLNWLNNSTIIFDGLTDASQHTYLDYYIYKLDLTNNSVSQLINEHGLEPKLSPNKKKLAYVAIKKTKTDKYGNSSGYEKLKYINIKNGLKNGLSKTIKTISYEVGMDIRAYNDPRWSPNGKRIVVHSNGNDVSGGIFTYDLKGKNLGGFYTDTNTNNQAYGYAEFYNNNWLIFKSTTAATPSKYYLRFSKIDGTKGQIIKEGQFSVWKTGDISLSAKLNKLLYSTYNLNKDKAGNIYLYSFKTKKSKVLAYNSDGAVWQP